MNGAPVAFRKGISARHGAGLIKAEALAGLGRCAGLVGRIVELLWKPRAPNALAASLAVLVVGLLSVCIDKQESERRERWQRRDFYLPPWHKADIFLHQCIITVGIAFYLPFMSAVCLFVLGVDVTSTPDRRRWGCRRSNKSARCFLAVGDSDTPSPMRVSPRNRHISVGQKNFYYSCMCQHSYEKFKLLFERKRLNRFCIYFGIMTVYQLQRFCSFRWQMILWFLVVRWKKVKGKVLHWGTSAPQPKTYCAVTPKEFLHSSLEALHTERYAAPQLAKEGTMWREFS
jgi:hypothetical protein